MRGDGAGRGKEAVRVTEKMYRDAIAKATKALGVYRLEFSRTRCRLAQIYVRIEQLQKGLESGEFEVTRTTMTKSGMTEQVDPHITELDRLNDQALAYEKALGLTADALKKISDAPGKSDGDDPLAKAFRMVGAG